MTRHAKLPVNTRQPVDYESSIREDIWMSARRMVAGLEVARVEQGRLSKYIAMLEKHGGRGAASRFAHDTGISRQLVCEVLSGRKKVGTVAARRIAKVKI